MDGAHGVLLSISGGSDLGLFEINEAAQLVADAAHEDANIIFGAVIDDALGDEVRVTVIAAGFDAGVLPHRRVEAPRRVAEPAGREQSHPRQDAPSWPQQPRAQQSQPQQSQPQQSQPQAPAQQPQRQPQQVAQQRPAQPPQPQQSPSPQPQQRYTPSPEPERPARRTVVFEDDLDVPDFLK